MTATATILNNDVIHFLMIDPVTYTAQTATGVMTVRLMAPNTLYGATVTNMGVTVDIVAPQTSPPSSPEPSPPPPSPTLPPPSPTSPPPSPEPSSPPPSPEPPSPPPSPPPPSPEPSSPPPSPPPPSPPSPPAVPAPCRTHVPDCSQTSGVCGLKHDDDGACYGLYTHVGIGACLNENGEHGNFYAVSCTDLQCAKNTCDTTPDCVGFDLRNDKAIIYTGTLSITSSNADAGIECYKSESCAMDSNIFYEEC